MGKHYGKSLGQVAFEAYNNAGDNPGKTHDGKDVPEWDKLGGNVQAKWQSGAQAVADMVTNNRGVKFPDHQIPPELPRV